MNPRTAILAALGAALLFGASTPLAKALVGDMSPMLLAGLRHTHAFAWDGDEPTLTNTGTGP